uniref:Uncharacterized protein n=1 Tax=Anguilla anguilla TaxID=7936 RepID=A0A0E9XZS3_ANGAN
MLNDYMDVLHHTTHSKNQHTSEFNPHQMIKNQKPKPIFKKGRN